MPEIPPILKRSQAVAVATTVVTLLAGGGALLAADYGASAWLIVPLLTWSLTVGLPTVLAVLAVVAIWGTAEPLYGFVGFAIAAVSLAVLAQFLVIVAFNKLTKNNA